MKMAAQRVHMGGVDVEKILTPEERADKDKLVAALEHRLFAIHAQRTGAGVARFSRFQNPL
jgi:hypothetical protein